MFSRLLCKVYIVFLLCQMPGIKAGPNTNVPPAGSRRFLPPIAGRTSGQRRVTFAPVDAIQVHSHSEATRVSSEPPAGVAHVTVPPAVVLPTAAPHDFVPSGNPVADAVAAVGPPLPRIVRTANVLTRPESHTIDLSPAPSPSPRGGSAPR